MTSGRQCAFLGSVYAVQIASVISTTPMETVTFGSSQRQIPSGRLYNLMPLNVSVNEDMSARAGQAEPHTVLDPRRTARRVGEAILTGLAFARALACDPESTSLGFAFRWTGLRGRHLTSLSVQRFPDLSFLPTDSANDDTQNSFITVPLETAPNAVALLVGEVLRPLLAAFNGYTMDPNLIEHIISEVHPWRP